MAFLISHPLDTLSAITRNLTCFVIAICLSSVILIPSAKADRLVQAQNLVTTLIADLEQVEASSDRLTQEMRKQRLSEIMDQYFDVEGITRFTAGRYWRSATEEQRALYTRLFRGVLLSEASTRFNQILNFTFTPTTISARGKKLILVTGIVHDKTGELPDAEIIWRISAIPDREMKIIDLLVENISMLQVQQDENTALVKRNGGDFAILIEAMQARLEQIKNQSAQ
jgi:phospholipid transport system substrate-binding protein